MKNEQKILKLVVITIFIILLVPSASSSLLKTSTINEEKPYFDGSSPPMQTLDEPIYTWSDEFDNEQWIESTMSYDYEVNGGNAKMKGTYEIWTDPSWTKMMPISLRNNAGKTLNNYAIHLTVDYDSDMKSNYNDVRFKHGNTPTQWLPLWIENYDTNDAEFWVNIPTLPTGTSDLYMFYGKPSATSVSNFYGVFQEWEEEWANDEKLSTHVYSEDAEDSDVCFGNNKFLVVWEEGQELYPPYTLFWKHDIRGSIYDTSGNVINEDFTIRSGQGTQWHHENPSAAYGGGKFFVAWEHYYTSTDPSSMNIKARLVTTSGSAGSDIVVCEDPNVQADPMVKFDNINNRFCVVWEDARQGTGNYNIYAKLYDTNGNQIGAEKDICTQSNNQFEPWVAFDPLHQQYMIVYEEKVGDFEIDIYGQLFDKNLNSIGSRFKVADGSSSTRYIYPCVEFSSEADRYLVTYNSGTTSKPYRGSIYGKTYDSGGNLKSSAIIKSGTNFVRTDIAPYLETAFLVCFNGGGKIWGRFITVDGEIDTYDEMGDIQLSASNSATADWVNVASDEDEIFVTWEDTRVDYAAPFEDYADAYGNIWHLNIGDSNDVTITPGSEKQLITEACITSKEITAENLFRWHDFDVTYSGGNIRFDILDASGDPVSGYTGISPGLDLSSLNEDAIRLRATFTRNDPSSSPALDRWQVRYIGEDDEDPCTTLDHIDGLKGQNGWYNDESLTIWLKASDFPEQTGSGVDATYYTINSGNTEIYSDASGIQLSATQASNWMGEWDVNFWSVDKAGNVENKNKPENKLHFKIDAEDPYVEIVEPPEEEDVEMPFWMRAYATDNGQIDRVEFNIEIDGDWLPKEKVYKDYEPPYEWFCDVKRGKAKILSASDPEPTGVSVMIKAEVFDESGRSWSHEIWIYITNWNNVPKQKTSFIQLLTTLKLAIEIDKTLDINMPTNIDADKIKMEATKIFTRKTYELWDNDLTDGCDASFDIPSGFYKITGYSYKDNDLIDKNIISRVFYLAK